MGCMGATDALAQQKQRCEQPWVRWASEWLEFFTARPPHTQPGATTSVASPRAQNKMLLVGNIAAAQAATLAPQRAAWRRVAHDLHVAALVRMAQVLTA